MNDMTGRAGRKVAVLGPIPRDQVVTHAGERFHKYGCVHGGFPNINTSGITSPADRGDVVEPRYIDQNRRVERQTSFMNPGPAGRHR